MEIWKRNKHFSPLNHKKKKKKKTKAGEEMTKAYFKRGHGEGVNMNFFKPNFFTSGLQRGKAQTIHEKAFLYRG